MPSVDTIQNDINLIKEAIKNLESALDYTDIDDDTCASMLYNLKDCAWSIMRVEAVFRGVRQ